MTKKRSRYPVGHPSSVIRAPEPTIWALRKNVAATRQDNVAPVERSLYEHIYGYEPIRVTRDNEETIRKGSAENPGLNIINPATNFVAVQIASEDLPKA